MSRNRFDDLGLAVNRKKRILSWIVGCSLFLFAALCMTYFYLAFLPTGFERMSRSAGDARKHVAELMRPRFVAATTHTLETAPPDGHKNPENARVEVDPAGVLNFYVEVLSFETAAIRNERIAKSAPAVDALAQIVFDAGSGGYWECKRADAPPRTAAILPLLTDAEREDLLHRTKQQIADRSKPVVVKVSVSPDERELLHDYLDELEEFLLRENWDLSPPPAGSVEWRGLQSYHIKVMMAVARECLRGRQSRAMQLIDRYFETIRLMNVFYLQNPEISSEYVLPPTWMIALNMRELPEFPETGWEHIRAGLERLALTRSDMDDLRRMRALAWHELFARRVAERQYEASSDGWHRFGGGIFESAVNAAVEPIAMRQIERMAVRQMESIDRDLQKPKMLSAVLKMMNMSEVGKMNLDKRSLKHIHGRFTSSGFHYPSALARLEEYRFRNRSDAMMIERFPVAYVRKWSKEWIDGEKRTIGRSDYPTTSPVARFEREHRRLPDTAEEINHLQQQPGGEDIWNHVTWFDSRRMLITWSVRPYSDFNYIDVDLHSDEAAFIPELRHDLAQDNRSRTTPRLN